MSKSPEIDLSVLPDEYYAKLNEKSEEVRAVKATKPPKKTAPEKRQEAIRKTGVTFFEKQISPRKWEKETVYQALNVVEDPEKMLEFLRFCSSHQGELEILLRYTRGGRKNQIQEMTKETLEQVRAHFIVKDVMES